MCRQDLMLDIWRAMDCGYCIESPSVIQPAKLLRAAASTVLQFQASPFVVAFKDLWHQSHNIIVPPMLHQGPRDHTSTRMLHSGSIFYGPRRRRDTRNHGLGSSYMSIYYLPCTVCYMPYAIYNRILIVRVACCAPIHTMDVASFSDGHWRGMAL